MNTAKLKKFEIAGVLIIYAAASLLHFLYRLTDGNIFAILFGAVNESVWENIKNFIFPYAAWGVLELFLVRPPFKQFVVAKVTALYFLIAANIVIFYTYTFFTGGPVLIADLIISVLVLIASQYLSFRLTFFEKDLSGKFAIAAFLLFLLIVMFFTFTAFPPKADLFRDRITGAYGIPVAGLLPEAVFNYIS